MAAASRRLAALRRQLAAPAAAAVPELPSWYAQAETVDETVARVEMDAASWRAHRLSPQAREQFDRDGYLIIHDVLPQADFERCCAALDELRELRRSQGLPADKSVLDPVFSSSHTLWREEAVVRMLKAPKVLPKVTDIMGWNVYLYHGHLTVDPPFRDGPSVPAESEQSPFGFHRDSGRVNQELEVPSGTPVPRLSVKAAFYLSDLSEPGRGQTWVIPGTHKLGHDSPNPPARSGDDGGSRQPQGAIPLLVPPNSCAIFDRRLLHASSPNWSEHERKAIFYGYGYRWMRSKDVMDVGGALQGDTAACPVTKQLLGWTITNNGIFSPKAEDVPLREWMERHGMLDEDVGIDTVNHGGPLGSYIDSGYPWQSHGDRPHSFNAVKRNGME